MDTESETMIQQGEQNGGRPVEPPSAKTSSTKKKRPPRALRPDQGAAAKGLSKQCSKRNDAKLWKQKPL